MNRIVFSVCIFSLIASELFSQSREQEIENLTLDFFSCVDSLKVGEYLSYIDPEVLNISMIEFERRDPEYGRIRGESPIEYWRRILIRDFHAGAKGIMEDISWRVIGFLEEDLIYVIVEVSETNLDRVPKVEKLVVVPLKETDRGLKVHPPNFPQFLTQLR